VDFFLELSLQGLLIGGLYAVIALGIVVVCKATEVVSLAHGQLLAFGALFFFVAYVPLGLPLWASLLIGMAAGGVLGFACERICLRPLIGQPLFAGFLMTFAIFLVLDGIFALILQGECWGFPDFLPAGFLTIAGVRVSIGGLTSLGISLVVFAVTMLLFRYTKVGLVVAMVGGLDSLPGALLGGLILGLVENLAAGYLDPIVGGGVMEVAGYILLLLILLVRPYGIFGLVRIERV